MNRIIIFLIAAGLLIPFPAYANQIEIIEHPILTDYAKDDTIVFSAKVKNNGDEARSVSLNFFIGRSDKNMKYYAFIPIKYTIAPGETGAPPTHRIVKFPASTLKGGKWKIYAQVVNEGCYDTEVVGKCLVYDTKVITTHVKK